MLCSRSAAVFRYRRSGTNSISYQASRSQQTTKGRAVPTTGWRGYGTGPPNVAQAYAAESAADPLPGEPAGCSKPRADERHLLPYMRAPQNLYCTLAVTVRAVPGATHTWL
jgi:hypothetical protein